MVKKVEMIVAWDDSNKDLMELSSRKMAEKLSLPQYSRPMHSIEFMALFAQVMAENRAEAARIVAETKKADEKKKVVTDSSYREQIEKLVSDALKKKYGGSSERLNRAIHSPQSASVIPDAVRNLTKQIRNLTSKWNPNINGVQYVVNGDTFRVTATAVRYKTDSKTWDGDFRRFLFKLNRRHQELKTAHKIYENQFGLLTDHVIGDLGKEMIQLLVANNKCYKKTTRMADGTVLLELCELTRKNHVEMVALVSKAIAWRNQTLLERETQECSMAAFLRGIEASLYLKDEWAEVTKKHDEKEDDGSFERSLTAFRDKVAERINHNESAYGKPDNPREQRELENLFTSALRKEYGESHAKLGFAVRTLGEDGVMKQLSVRLEKEILEILKDRAEKDRDYEVKLVPEVFLVQVDFKGMQRPHQFNVNGLTSYYFPFE